MDHGQWTKYFRRRQAIRHSQSESPRPPIRGEGRRCQRIARTMDDGQWTMKSQLQEVGAALTVARRLYLLRGRQSRPWRRHGNAARKFLPRSVRPRRGPARFHRAESIRLQARARDLRLSARPRGVTWLRGEECRGGRHSYQKHFHPLPRADSRRVGRDAEQSVRGGEGKDQITLSKNRFSVPISDFRFTIYELYRNPIFSSSLRRDVHRQARQHRRARFIKWQPQQFFNHRRDE